jgi:hypothetical protein
MRFFDQEIRQFRLFDAKLCVKQVCYIAMFQEGSVSNRTISEVRFENLCASKGVDCERIPESAAKTADYRVSLGSTTIVAEVKQLDPNNDDKKLAEVWGTPQSPGAVAPSDRVQGLLDDGYSQINGVRL